MQSSTSHHGGSCLGRTCLKWRHDGELARADLELVLERLAKVDLDMAAERQLPTMLLDQLKACRTRIQQQDGPCQSMGVCGCAARSWAGSP